MPVVRYVFGGGVAAFVDITLFVALISLAGLHYLLAGALGFVIATWVNYELSVRHVFASGARFTRRAELMAVYVVSGVGLIWHQLVLYVAVEAIGTNVYLAKISAIAIVFFWNYLSRKHFVFAPASSDY